ncbi:protein of unknown function [Nocardioides scoriae]|uniref:DnaJ homologue subfamily C member 28 conserved domain-containing protein n=1 Tax=Nocardioides scoriae TaxID=642780 RepID=A0A1H1WGH6_9ACTN|nr:DUF1992 domain-containing protein [Nocardioides scoriae]SDS96184.1 protein of unknown function [Nocardioides scoriae]
MTDSPASRSPDPGRSRPDVDRRHRGRDDQERDARTGSSAAATRIQHQARWVDLQIERAMARGDFDNLPGQGKPLGDLGSPYDRDWWLKKLIEREQITGVLPEALQLRKDDAELDALLDRESLEKRVRELVEGFNRRIVVARRQLQGGPPVVTPTRDVEQEVRRWRERLDERRRANAEAARRTAEEETTRRGRRERRERRWWRRA